MHDIFFFWNILLQIISVKTVARSIAELSWDDQIPLGTLQKAILIIVLVFGIIDLCVLLYYVYKLISRFWSWWLHIIQMLRLSLLIYILVTTPFPNSPTNAYYAAWQAFIFSTLSAILKCIDYARNGSSIGKCKLSARKRTVIFVLFWNFMILFVGALIFKYIEDVPFHDSWIFVNVTALTIGYGNVVPQSTLGKVYIVTVGNFFIFMAAYFVVVLRDIIPASHLQQKRNGVLLFLCIIMYVTFGALVLRSLEGWAFIDSIYFTWKTLSTVGYGDIVPSKPITWEFWLLYVYISCSLYAFGLAIVINALSKMIKRHTRTIDIPLGPHADHSMITQ